MNSPRLRSLSYFLAICFLTVSVFSQVQRPVASVSEIHKTFAKSTEMPWKVIGQQLFEEKEGKNGSEKTSGIAGYAYQDIAVGYVSRLCNHILASQFQDSNTKLPLYLFNKRLLI
jgi:hypothetical protein